MGRSSDVALDRLHAQRLVRPLATPAEVVAHLLAVQSQDFGGALWAVGQRARGVTAADVARVYDDGDIVRTHVLRPTWHFVARADLRWLLALTAPRIQAGKVTAYKNLDLTTAQLERATAVIANELRGQTLTRDELAKRLPFRCEGTPLAHVMIHAELAGVIVSGPRRGKQHTYALLDERIPAQPVRPRDDALAELARRYVAGHGPAQAIDLAWWSGLMLGDARRALALAELPLVEIAGVGYHAVPSRATVSPTLRLLPNYDELLVGFADRAAAIDPRVVGKLAREAIFDHTVVANGRVIGTYKLVRARAATTIACTLLVEPTRAERAALAAEATRFGAFHGVTAKLG